MIIDILTLFPEMFAGPFDMSMLKKAKDMEAVKITIHNLRNWAVEDKHKTVDDRHYGGGAGMVIRVDVVDKALKDLKTPESRVILLSPQGEMFNQTKTKKLSKLKHLILIAGHYEGFDQRILDHLIDEEVSIGKYVLTGGELPAMVITDTIVRLLPGVLEAEATTNESFSKGENFDFPQYTRPDSYEGWSVPDVLKTGDHKKINEWRGLESIKKRREKL